MKLQKYILSASLICLLLNLSSSVFAQAAPAVGGVMAFAAVATQVPTLSSSMLIIMSLLIAALAYRLLKKNNHKPTQLIISLIAIGILSFGYGGVRFVNDVYAGMAAPIPLTNTWVVNLEAGDHEYTNNLGVTVKITSMTGIPGQDECAIPSFFPSNVNPQCTVDLEISNGSSCGFNCISVD